MLSLFGHCAGLFLLVFLLRAAQVVFIDRKRQQLRREVQQAQQRAASIRKQAAALNTPATFTSCAKLERQAIAVEKQGTQRQQQLDSLGSSRLARNLVSAKVLMWAVCALWYWSSPLLFAPPGLLLPLPHLFSSPHVWLWKGTGAVTALPWLGLCDAATAALLSRLLPA